MLKEVMIRRQLRQAGNEVQLIKVGVLSQRGDTLRVVRPGETRPFEVKASEVVDAAPIFANQKSAQTNGIVPVRQFSDNSSSISNIIAARTRSRFKHGESAGKHKFVAGRLNSRECAVCGKSHGASAHDVNAAAANSKAKKKVKTWPIGTEVSWHYRSAIGHGKITKVATLGTSHDTTKYAIAETDHHPGEPAIVYHFGSALTRA